MEHVLLCNVGWMNEYRGKTDRDPAIIRGGSDRRKTEWFNFKDYRGRAYGYVQPPGRTGRIAIERLGGSRGIASVEGVTVVWTARDPETPVTRVVGWYTDATVYREPQEPTGELAQARTVVFQDGPRVCAYNIETTVENSWCVPPHQREKSPVQRGKGGFGRPNIHYPEGASKEALLRLIALPWAQSADSAIAPRQFDPATRVQVERAAMNAAAEWFIKRGFHVDDVSDRNLGWDLHATRDETVLHVEVKGLSAGSGAVELTPNENKPVMSQYTDYRLCVVTNALDAARNVHVYLIEADALVDQHGHRTETQRMVGATLRIQEG